MPPKGPPPLPASLHKQAVTWGQRRPLRRDASWFAILVRGPAPRRALCTPRPLPSHELRLAAAFQRLTADRLPRAPPYRRPRNPPGAACARAKPAQPPTPAPPPVTPPPPTARRAPGAAPKVALFYLGAMGYYLFVRIARTLDMPYKWYSILILVVECLGARAGAERLL